MKNLTKKLMAIILSGAICLMAGCSSAQSKAPEEVKESEVVSETSAEVSSESTESSLKSAVLVVSFGTSYSETRAETIEAVEKKIAEAFPESEMRRAFTSQIIIDKIKKTENLSVDNVTEAMERLVADGIKDVTVQPTHVMNGFEYDDVIKEITNYKDKFDSIKVGLPLLSSDEDYDSLISVIMEETAQYNKEKTAVVFMGHGTEHEANATYAKLQEKINDKGTTNYFIGTVEATPSVEDVIAKVKKTDAEKVVLLPLMIVAGDHANNDMAGDEADSWKTLFKAEGYEVECVLKGMGSYDGIKDLFVLHAKNASAF